VNGPRFPSAPLLHCFAALAYEAVLYSALILIAGFLTIPLLPAAPSGVSGLQVPDLPARVLSFLVVFAAGALYYTWSWTGGRRTLPMKTWRLRLVRDDGTAPDRGTALVRYFAVWIGPAFAVFVVATLPRSGYSIYAVLLVALNFVWAFVDPDRRFLHDRVAGTRIVSDEVPSPTVRSG
jgi:uncharacterized RDD family membrane protein YckC